MSHSSASPLSRLATPLVLHAAGACTALAPRLVESAFLMRRGSFAVRESALLTPDQLPLSACVLPTLDPYLMGPERLFALTDLALSDLPESLKGQLAGLRLKVYPLLDQAYAGQLPNGQRRGDSVGFELKHRVERALHSSVPTEVTARDVTALPELLPQISADLAKGLADVALVIAAHSDLYPERISQLFEAHRLYSDDNDDGILPGEAAVVLAFCTPQTARLHQLPQLLRILATHHAYDPARADNDASAFAAVGLTLALRGALDAATDAGGGVVGGRVAEGKVGWWFSDVHFEQYRIHEYQAILARCQDAMTEPQVHEFPAQRLGFAGCATVPLHIALAAVAWRHGYAPAPVCASLSGHDDGSRCCVVMAR